jgi:hypothetical protein
MLPGSRSGVIKAEIERPAELPASSRAPLAPEAGRATRKRRPRFVF